MIDKNYRESELSIAKKIAAKYINNPVIDLDGSGKNSKKVTSILVINREHSVYVNTPIESVQAYADKIKATVTVVMENGKVLEEKKDSEPVKKEVTVEENPNGNEPKSEKKNNKKK